MKYLIIMILLISSCATCPTNTYVPPQCPKPTPLIIEPKPEVETDIDYIDRIRRIMVTMKYKIKELEEIIRCYEEQSKEE